MQNVAVSRIFVNVTPTITAYVPTTSTAKLSSLNFWEKIFKRTCVATVYLKFSQGFYFYETSQMRSFVKIKSSRNGEILLSFTNAGKSCPSCEFLMWQICLLMVFAKIFKFTVCSGTLPWAFDDVLLCVCVSREGSDETAQMYMLI